MSGTLIAILYLIGYALSLRPIFRWQLNDALLHHTEWFDIIISMIMAVMIGFFWPFLFIGACLKHTVGKGDPETFARRVGGECKEQKMERKREELRSHQEIVERLERELSIEC